MAKLFLEEAVLCQQKSSMGSRSQASLGWGRGGARLGVLCVFELAQLLIE